MTKIQEDAGVLAGDERILIAGELQNTGRGATFDIVHPASARATDGTVDEQSGPGYRNGEEGYKEYLAAKTIGMPG